MKTLTKLWLFVMVLAVISPIGLIVPAYFKAGSAWGEWGAGELKGLVGYIPQGLMRLSSQWNAPIPDYAFKGWVMRPLSHLSAAYIVSAIIGVLMTVGVIFLIGKLLSKKE